MKKIFFILLIEIASSPTKPRRHRTAKNVPGPYPFPFYGTMWIYSCFGYYDMNKIHDAYKGRNSQKLLINNIFF